MRELSLFTGAGGGLLGTHLLGWRPVGYVEINDYCQRVIAARIRDGLLPDAPIFGDIHAFIREGYASAYQGMVDVITGGFPCQPFSLAGKRRADADERNGWPATIECIRLVRPRWALLENVPGLLTTGYFGTVLGDLAESGYDCRWRILSAAEMGAPHKRDRLWILAYPNGNICRIWTHQYKCVAPCNTKADTCQAREVADAEYCGCEIGDSDRQGANTTLSCGKNDADAKCQGLEIWKGETGKRPFAAIRRSDWWSVEPGLGRVAHGVAHRVDRLGALGNGQVPDVVALAWLLLTDDA